MLISKNLIDAEQILNNIYEEYCVKDTSREYNEFTELKLQAAIVQYEFCALIKEINDVKENTFARKVSIKSFIHCVYEYDKTLRQNHIKRMCALAIDRGLPDVNIKIREIGKKWRKDINKISMFKDVRDKTSGHYDSNIVNQVSHIELIDEETSMEVIANFLRYNVEILKALGLIAKGHV